MVLRPHQLRQSFKKPKKRQRSEGSPVAEEDAAENEAEGESAARTAGEAEGRPDEVSNLFKRKVDRALELYVRTERTLNRISTLTMEASNLYQWSESFGLDFLEMRINDQRGMNDICSCHRLFIRVVKTFPKRP